VINLVAANIAATRLITDSSASDNNPTESVSQYAAVFRVIVANAAAIDSHANRVRFFSTTDWILA